MLTATFRSTDIVGRLGGDEFAVIMTNCKEGRCKIAITRLQELITNHNLSSGRGYDLAFSVGIEIYIPNKHHTFEALLASADATMFENKRQRQSA